MNTFENLCYILIFFVYLTSCHNKTSNVLPEDWDPKYEADHVMQRLVKVTSPKVKGAHDSHFVVVDNHVYIVYMANDEKPGESPEWPFVRISLTIIDKNTLQIEKIISVAKSGQVFNNDTLPIGACFVPRIIQKNKNELRCFFASENPGVRQSQIWYIDFDISRMEFDNNIYQPKLQTFDGTFEMQPQYFHADAKKHGFKREMVDYGFYPFDFKSIDDRRYVVLNNFPGGQNALSSLNENLDTFQLLGHYDQPFNLKFTESSVEQLPDSSWISICRQEGGNRNYFFSTSRDGVHWEVACEKNFVQNGTSAKPTINKFNNIYYLGWQEATTINGAFRSVFNIDISTDCKKWERKYRFETEESFQYPSFFEDNGTVWLSVTQGGTSPSGKERIMFGRLE